MVTPALFSFNNPRGACADCNGFGAVLEYDESLIVPDPERSLAQGAIDPVDQAALRDAAAAAARVRPQHSAPTRRSPGTSSRPASGASCSTASKGRYVGIFPFLKGLEEKRYKQYIRVFLRQYQLAHTCAECRGTRLNPDALAVRIGERDHRLGSSPLGGRDLPLAGRAPAAGRSSARSPSSSWSSCDARLGFLRDVGLGYLTLDRQTRTLSGGEAQRIALANALGSRLVDTLYVLDEPSIGLHPRDTDRLLALLRRLRDAGNTVIVVEHDLAADRSRPTSCSSSGPARASAADAWSTPARWPGPRSRSPGST